MTPEEKNGERKASTIIVTGASRGLGRGIALELARCGFSVAVLFGKNSDEADRTLALCEAERHSSLQRFEKFKVDIACPADRERCVQEIFSAFSSVDGLVNNAGMAPRVRADILDASLESFREVVQTNLEGPHFFTQLVVRRWLENSARGDAEGNSETCASSPLLGKRVVFITSISSDTVSLNRGEYCISKAGLSMSASLWAARLAPLGGLAFEIRPGIMKTDMTKAVEAKYEALIEGGLVPARRWGSPEDVGKAVRAVICGDFDFAAGSTIYMDGGLHIAKL